MSNPSRMIPPPVLFTSLFLKVPEKVTSASGAAFSVMVFPLGKENWPQRIDVDVRLFGVTRLTSETG